MLCFNNIPEDDLSDEEDEEDEDVPGDEADGAAPGGGKKRRRRKKKKKARGSKRKIRALASKKPQDFQVRMIVESTPILSSYETQQIFTT